jgi:hypothetical protein
MTPSERTPQERDRRFARVRLATQSILMGSLAASMVFVGYASNTAHVAVATTAVPAVTSATTPTTNPATVVSASYGDNSGSDDGFSNAVAGAPAVQTTPATVKTNTAYTPPSTAPVKAATVCTTTPSGRMVCH